MLAPARYITEDKIALAENMSSSSVVSWRVGALREVYSPEKGVYGISTSIVEADVVDFYCVYRAVSRSERSGEMPGPKPSRTRIPS